MKKHAILPFITLVIIACNADVKQQPNTPAAGDSAVATSSDSGGMGSMPGMAPSGGSSTATMIADMKVKLADIEKVKPDSLEIVVPGHRAAAAALLSEMNREMAAMQMQGDSRWSAIADSVRQDLIMLPETKGGALSALVAAHKTRMLRMMQMHEDMMKH
jgi:hypothetical protein